MLFNFTSLEFRKLGDGPAVYFELVSNLTFSITADKHGVSVSGNLPVLTTQEELDELQQVMQWAYRHYQSICSTGQPLNQDDLTKELRA